MPVPTLTPPPAEGPPTGADPTNFPDRADGWNLWIEAFFYQLVTAVSWMATQLGLAQTAATDAAAAAATATSASAGAVAAGIYTATSTTARSAQAGSQTHTLVETSRGFVATDRVTAIRRGAPDVRKRGAVTAYAANVLTVTWDDVPVGATATTYTDWLIQLTALEMPDPTEAIGMASNVAFAAKLF